MSRGFVAIQLQSLKLPDGNNYAFVRGAMAQKSNPIVTAKRRSITPTNVSTRSERSHWKTAAPINTSTRINPRTGRKSMTLKREPAGADCGSFVVYARSVSSGSIEHGHLSSKIARKTVYYRTVHGFYRPYYSHYFPLMQLLLSALPSKWHKKTASKA